MRRRLVEHLLWCAVAAGPVTSYALLKIDPGEGNSAITITMSAPPDVRAPARDSIALAGAVLVRGNPFRFDRKPSAVPYQPELEGAPPPPPAAPKPPKPVLVLRGIVGGPPWDAMVEGIPDRQGPVLVRRGDTLGGLTIRAIRRDTVIIQGADTTWRLTIKRAW